MNHLLKKGINVPEDIAVASFSGTELSTIVYPQLTTIEQPHIKMGETAAELVLRKIKNNSPSDETILLEAALIIRGSTVAFKE